MATWKKRLIFIVIIVVLATCGIVYYFMNRFTYNDEDDTGNTTGNLYNGGVFCESNGYVYFANPYDEEALYRMKNDGSEVKKLCSDRVSYINVCGDYVYYRRHNDKTGVDVIFRGNLYGIYRIKTKGGDIKELHRGIVGAFTLSGNYLYYQEYDETKFNLCKVKVDGKEDERLIEKSYIPACVVNRKLYFCEINNNHNLLSYNPSDNKLSTVEEGNIYLPDFYKGYMYYIDCDNDRALTKKNMDTGETTVISEKDHVINYNMNGDVGVIFYQAENDKLHRLVEIDLDGRFSQEVALGDFANISITSTYTYFYRIFGEERNLYRTPTKGIANPELYLIH